VGLYSLLGAGIWCRYFCPWVGLFGLVAKFGRYADVKFSPGGEAYVTVDYPRMYDLIDSPHWGHHVLELRFETPGTLAYSFTFGTVCS
jgi:hypothetical protein